MTETVRKLGLATAYFIRGADWFANSHALQVRRISRLTAGLAPVGHFLLVAGILGLLWGGSWYALYPIAGALIVCGIRIAELAFVRIETES